MSYSDAEIWAIIAIMGIGTYLIRFSFLGLIGNRSLPEWALRHLRYTPVAVLPGLVAPLVLLPENAGDGFDLLRIAPAIATVAFAWWRKSMFPGIVAGVATFAALSYLA